MPSDPEGVWHLLGITTTMPMMTKMLMIKMRWDFNTVHGQWTWHEQMNRAMVETTEILLWFFCEFHVNRQECHEFELCVNLNIWMEGRFRRIETRDTGNFILKSYGPKKRIQVCAKLVKNFHTETALIRAFVRSNTNSVGFPDFQIFRIFQSNNGSKGRLCRNSSQLH